MTAALIIAADLATVVPLWRLGFFRGLPRDAPFLALLIFPVLTPLTAALAIRCLFDAPFRRTLAARVRSGA